MSQSLFGNPNNAEQISAIENSNKLIQKENAEKNQVMQSINTLGNIHKNNLASEFAKRLDEIFQRFRESLDSEYKVGMVLVSSGNSNPIILNLQNISYFEPSLIIFSGITEDNKEIELVQHTSQINFILVGLSK